MTDAPAKFVVRYVKRGTRRVAYVRPVDQPDGWLRMRMVRAQELLQTGVAVEETR